MIKIDKGMDQLKKVDDLLFEEMREVSDFEAELFSLEYELAEEERLIAKLHNLCHVTTNTIKHLHSLVRRVNSSASDKTIPFLKKMIERQIESLENDLKEIAPRVQKLKKDEKAGEKILKYCNKVQTILSLKLGELKVKYSKI